MTYRLFCLLILISVLPSCKDQIEQRSMAGNEEAELNVYDTENPDLDSNDASLLAQDIEVKSGELPEQIPEGMVYVPGGITTIGSENGLAHEKPVFTTKVSAFFMDKHPVTVGDYREFVKETGYVTFSEEIGDGIIFDLKKGGWYLKEGAYWEYPLGPDQPRAKDDHPVTLLTFEEAEAYLKWVGKRLPAEIEWEHAARGVTKRNEPYAWGDQLEKDGVFMANTWTGIFPVINNGDDGYVTTAPVGIFGETELGLTDMGGNVWEWTSSWYRSYADRDEPFIPNKESEKVLRGGSFMCNASYCHGYRVSARSNTPPSNNMFHIGFRGVRDL